MSKHLARLAQMLKRMDAHEAHMQIMCGDLVKGSIRASELTDARALRAVLAMVREAAPC